MNLSNVPVDLIIHIINIIVLFVILRVLLYKPVKKFMSERAQRLEDEKKSAELDRNEAARLKADYESRLTAAQEEANGIIREKSEQAVQKGENIISDAKTSAGEIIESAKNEAENIKKRAVEDSKKQIVVLASEMAEKILCREINDKDNEKLTQEFFAEMDKK